MGEEEEEDGGDLEMKDEGVNTVEGGGLNAINRDE